MAEDKKKEIDVTVIEVTEEYLKEKGKEAWYLPTFDEIEKFVMEHCTQGDLLITMGAGDVVNVGENLLAK